MRAVAGDGRDPERFLRRLRSEERRRARGRLKIYLAYAPGVEASFRMLDEGRRRRERGQDVVVGALQAGQPSDVRGIVQGLEIVPTLRERGGETLDVEALVRRAPRVCLIDGLAHDNPAGSRHAARWEDVGDLLAAGVTVIASVSVEELDEVSGQVEAATGRHAAATVPLSFVIGADGIVVVDAPLAPPDVTPPVGALSHLRELALLVAAQTVDRQLKDYLEEQGIAATWSAQERILVCVTPRSNAAMMIETARQASERFHATLFVLYVNQPNLGERDRQSIDGYLAGAERCGAQVERADGADPIRVILERARANNVTQIYIGHSLRHDWSDRVFGGPVDRLIGAADGIDVRVFPH